MMFARTVENFNQIAAAIAERAVTDFYKRARIIRSNAVATSNLGAPQMYVSLDVAAATVFEAAANEFFAELLETSSAEATTDTDARAVQLQELLGMQLSDLRRRLATAIEAGRGHHVAADTVRVPTMLDQLDAATARTRAELKAKIWLAMKKAKQTSGPRDPWHKRLLGEIGVKVTISLLSTAALAAIAIYFS